MGSFHSVESYLNLPRAPQTWVIEPLLPTSGKLNIFSSPKVGKSWAAIQMCADVAVGKPEWLGFPIRTAGPTLYLQLDTPRGLWTEYLLKMRKLNYSLQDIHVADIELVPSYPFDIRYKPHSGWLKEQVDKHQPVLVVVDVLREIFRGSENDSDTAQDVLSSLIAATHPAALVILSHVAKPGYSSEGQEIQRALVDMNRGNSYIAGVVDGLIHVTMKPNSDVGAFTYKSRTIAEHRKPLKRHESGLWLLPYEDTPLPTVSFGRQTDGGIHRSEQKTGVYNITVRRAASLWNISIHAAHKRLIKGELPPQPW